MMQAQHPQHAFLFHFLLSLLFLSYREAKVIPLRASASLPDKVSYRSCAEVGAPTPVRRLDAEQSMQKAVVLTDRVREILRNHHMVISWGLTKIWS